MAETLMDDPDLASWWRTQNREFLDDELVRAKDAGGRRILGAIQATPIPGGYDFLYGLRVDATPSEEYLVAVECWNRSGELYELGPTEQGQYTWHNTGGVLWVQLIDGRPFEPV